MIQLIPCPNTDHRDYCGACRPVGWHKCQECDWCHGKAVVAVLRQTPSLILTTHVCECGMGDPAFDLLDDYLTTEAACS